MDRVYLDWNATTPLRPEARAAMAAAMEVVGNPSSVHAEGRAARGVIERARAQVAAAFGAEGADIVFTSSATEAAGLAAAGRDLLCAGIEHDAVLAVAKDNVATDGNGKVSLAEPSMSTLQKANSETGIVQDLPDALALSDFTQAFGKIPVAFNWSGADMGLISAHKLGGPAGIGALVMRRGTDVTAQIRGGGQEMGRRSGTENLIGIAGFGAAAEAAARDLAAGVWDPVQDLRNSLEDAIEAALGQTIFIGKDVDRLPNTTCFALPGWKGETQVIAMDLAGFAISAGSACSSGKVKESRVLRAMGYSPDVARSAVRVSIGPTTERDDVMRFGEVWARAAERHQARAA